MPAKERDPTLEKAVEPAQAPVKCTAPRVASAGSVCNECGTGKYRHKVKCSKSQVKSKAETSAAEGVPAAKPKQQKADKPAAGKPMVKVAKVKKQLDKPAAVSDILQKDAELVPETIDAMKGADCDKHLKELKVKPIPAKVADKRDALRKALGFAAAQVPAETGAPAEKETKVAKRKRAQPGTSKPKKKVSKADADAMRGTESVGGLTEQDAEREWVYVSQSIAAEPAELDEADDLCTLCSNGGKLVCCDSCPRVFHTNCLKEVQHAVPQVRPPSSPCVSRCLTLSHSARMLCQALHQCLIDARPVFVRAIPPLGFRRCEPLCEPA